MFDCAAAALLVRLFLICHSRDCVIFFFCPAIFLLAESRIVTFPAPKRSIRTRLR